MCVCAVLLAPYGLTGVLTGRVYSDSDVKTQRLLEDWRRYFYIPTLADNAAEEGSHIPSFVEVVVGMLSHNAIVTRQLELTPCSCKCV